MVKEILKIRRIYIWHIRILSLLFRYSLRKYLFWSVSQNRDVLGFGLREPECDLELFYKIHNGKLICTVSLLL